VKRIYLDNNATTAIDPAVLDAMQPYWSPEYGNASSLHREGQLARRALEEARETIAELLDAEPRQVIFASGGTEANNLALLGLCGRLPAHAVTSSIEHPSVLGCFDLLVRRGFPITRVPVNSEGVVAVEEFSRAMQPDSRLATLMLVNNETGAVQPVLEVARECRRRGIALHVDGVQAIGKIPVSFRSLGVTSLSLSGHKFHGPVGIGALIVDRPELLQPVLTGGHQEFGVRPGTESVALAVGLAEALKLAVQSMAAETTRISSLCDRLEAALRALAGARLNGPAHHRSPNTANLQFPGLDGQAAVLALDLFGVACSTGSACASGAPTPSHTLLAMGLTERQARSSIRFSLSRNTTLIEIDAAIEAIARVVQTQQATGKN